MSPEQPVYRPPTPDKRIGRSGTRDEQVTQWAIASRLMGEHGADIAAYLDQQMRASLQDRDPALAASWLQVTRKIVRLRCLADAGVHEQALQMSSTAPHADPQRAPRPLTLRTGNPLS